MESIPKEIFAYSLKTTCAIRIPREAAMHLNEKMFKTIDMIVEYILQVSDRNDEGDEHIELADNLTDSF